MHAAAQAVEQLSTTVEGRYINDSTVGARESATQFAVRLNR